MSRNTCGSVEARIWTYTTDLQDEYTKNEMNAALFRDNGIDMLGPVETELQGELSNISIISKMPADRGSLGYSYGRKKQKKWLKVW